MIRSRGNVVDRALVYPGHIVGKADEALTGTYKQDRRRADRFATRAAVNPQQRGRLLFGRSCRSGFDPAAAAMGWLPVKGSKSWMSGRFLITRPAGINTDLPFKADSNRVRF